MARQKKNKLVHVNMPAAGSRWSIITAPSRATGLGSKRTLRQIHNMRKDGSGHARRKGIVPVKPHCNDAHSPPKKRYGRHHAEHRETTANYEWETQTIDARESVTIGILVRGASASTTIAARLKI